MPQLSSAYAFLALSFSTEIRGAVVFLIVSLVFATVIQVSTLLAYSRLKRKGVNIEERRDRPALFGIAISAYFIGFVLLRYLGAPFIFVALMFAYFANTMLAAVITVCFTKVSIHTWGITGPSVAILYSVGVVAFGLMLVAGAVVGYSRVALGYHTRAQVALSFFTSIPLTWFVVYIVSNILPALLGK